MGDVTRNGPHVISRAIKTRQLKQLDRYELCHGHLEIPARPLACVHGHVDDLLALSPTQSRAARSPCASLGAAIFGAVGHPPQGAGSTGRQWPGAHRGQPYFMAGHSGHACGPALPLCLQVRHPRMAAGGHAGHGRRHALHRTHQPQRCAAHGQGHGRGHEKRRRGGGLSRRHHQRWARALALSRQLDPGGHRRRSSGAARVAQVCGRSHRAAQFCALLHWRRHLGGLHVAHPERARHRCGGAFW